MPIYIGTLDYFIIIQYGNAHGEKQNSWPNWWHLRNILINLTLGLTEKISYVMSVLTAEKMRLWSLLSYKVPLQLNFCIDIFDQMSSILICLSLYVMQILVFYATTFLSLFFLHFSLSPTVLTQWILINWQISKSVILLPTLSLWDFNPQVKN